MYKIFMLIAIPILLIGWVAYWLWTRKLDEEEKRQPKESQRLTKTKGEISDWAKKMADFKKPEIKKPPDQYEQNEQE
ncbi:MAG: hypothetical protein ACYS17_13285 [Planctomycetota bacterium]|jgi:hypothetical protein